MSEKIKLKYLKPFGPGILSGYLPKNILDNFVKISDDVISKKIQKWNYQLVGRIDDEWKIPDLLSRDYEIADYLDNAPEFIIPKHAEKQLKIAEWERQRKLGVSTSQQ